jgi:hypothetical protein
VHNYRGASLWLKYAEMEMTHKFVNHARNVWDRAITLLPRIDQLWYKYIHMEAGPHLTPLSTSTRAMTAVIPPQTTRAIPT